MDKLNYSARPIRFNNSFNSQVDIIVPFHGQYDLLMELINSIFLLTRSNYYNLILVDDFSPNAEFLRILDLNSKKNSERLSKKNVLKVVRNSEQKGFAGACRVGYELGESPYVCFVNSDCKIVDSGWLKNMGETLINLKDKGVRMVSPTMNNPVGGDPAQKGERIQIFQEDVILDGQSFLSLPCFMCHRELFSKIGGFLKEYPYGYYEDEEIAARMKKSGYKQAVSKKSYVHHEGQKTILSIQRSNPNIKKIMEEENRKLCVEDMKKLI
jgi:GT2 family glycosyltransferase